MEEKGEGGSQPLQIDPKCLHDALRAFFKPIKNDDPRLDFYTVYKREATDYDTDYVKKYDEDLNITLIFAGLFSAVSSAFVIDVQSNLQPDPNEQSATILRLILLTLNQSAIPSESPAIPPVQDVPPSEIVTVSGLMYASLLISLLAAFVAMLGKQWLNRYLRHAGGSMIERCGDRQRKCDGLQEWPFHLFVEILPVMLQVALLLLACGLCRYMTSINIPVAGVLITFTALGVLFYLAIVIAGTSSYACPFQTPASTALRGLWRKIVFPPSFAIFKQAVVRTALNFEKWVRVTFGSRRHGHSQSPVVSPEEIREDSRISPEPNSSIHKNAPLTHVTNPPAHDASSSTHNTDPSHHDPDHPSQETDSLSRNTPTPGPWLACGDLTTIEKINAKDVRCVSWIIRNITDPEALDTAIRLAGTILWFDDGIDVEPPYDIITSTFRTCFDSTGAVYPGLLDRAYYSTRAILWIHVRAMCRGEEFARRSFPLPHIDDNRSNSLDLNSLLRMYDIIQRPWFLGVTNVFAEHSTPEHMQWASRALLHYYWARQRGPYIFLIGFNQWTPGVLWNIIPLDATLDLFLAWSIFFGCPVQKRALRIQDKTICLERVVSQLSRAIITAIPASRPRHRLLRGVLLELARWDDRPNWLRTMAYEWCSAICEGYQDLEDGRELLFMSLKIGFRGLDIRDYSTDGGLVHTKYHRYMADIVFDSGDDEVIVDLLQAWTDTHDHFNTRELLELLNTLPRHLIRLQHQISTSRRLRRLVIRSVENLGPQQVERVGVEEFTALLDHLSVGVGDMDFEVNWLRLLLYVVRSPQGRHCLPHSYWELMVELSVAADDSWLPDYPIDDDLQVMFALEEEEEWDMLECWSSIFWILLPPKIDTIPEGLERATLTLFRQRPGSVQKLRQRLQRSRVPNILECLERLRLICERGGLQVVWRQDAPSVSSTVIETVAHIRLPSSALQLLVGDDSY